MDGMAQKVKLKLFVSGATALSVKAILAVKDACSNTDSGLVDLEIIDVLQSKGVTREEDLLPLPSLFVLGQNIAKRFIGNEIQSSIVARELQAVIPREVFL